MNGSYNFRQVFYQVGSANGDLSTGRALSGTISFDGLGHYTMPSATLITRNASGTSSQQLTAIAGTYSIATNGYGFLSGIYCSSGPCPGGRLYVLFAQGVIVGSSPEENINDVFIAAPVGTAQSATTAFQGAWTFAGMIAAVGTSAGYSADTFFQATPSSGSLGNVSVTGYFGVNGGQQTTQAIQNVTYLSGNGSVSLNFPANYFYNGIENLFFSPDGTFCFGGSPNTPDLLVGVRTPASGSPQKMSGIYYTAGINQNEFFLSKGYVDFYTYYGALNTSGSKFVEADRMQDGLYGGATSSNSTFLNPGAINGTYSEPQVGDYAINSTGAIRVGAGIWPVLGLNVALKAPDLSGSGVFLNPNGVVNAASFAPFTAGISPGEYVVLYGSNLASTTTVASSLPLPTQLDNVKVTVNGIAAPIYYVSSGQISVIVPVGVSGPVAQIQVNNNGTASNTVTEFVYSTSPGLFTNPSDGVSAGAVEHADGSLVTQSNPAVPGETLELYLTGLGPVSPAVADGAAASASPLSRVMTPFTAYIGWAKGTITYAGLVPTLAGLYQLNIQVPDIVPNGDQIFELDGPDSASTQGVIPVKSNTTSQTPPAPK